MREPRSYSTTPLDAIPREALPRDTIALARFLIGTSLVRDGDCDRDDEETVVARIVETEAYLPGDAASHAFRGRTARNGAMFLERGHAYVYFIYGNYFCLNVSSETEGVGAAVLLRAAAPIAGVKTIRARSGDRPAERDLLRGPGRLARALAIDRRFDGIDLCAPGPLRIVRGDAVPPRIGCSVRIGLTKNADAPLRFYEGGHPLVSGPKRLAAN